MIRQATHNELLKGIKEKRRFVQVLAGPRQVGKTIVVRQVMEASKKTYNSRSGKVAPIFG
jgi:predicted AAA+ superfamily ATPase